MSELTYYGSTDGRQKLTLEQLFYNAINDSHLYRPTFKFYKNEYESDNPIFFGIELEFNTPSRDSRPNATNLLKGVNQHRRHFYCKRDGSLQTGFEFNSMPMTLDYLKEFKVADMNNLFKESLVYASDECGFHVHISRNNINNLKNFVESLYNIVPLLLFISNRKDYRSVSRFTSLFGSSRTPDYDDSDESMLDTGLYTNTGGIYKGLRKLERSVYNDARFMAHTKKSSIHKPQPYFAPVDDRYSFINLSNQNTVEIRLFKGTTDWGYVLNMISLLHSIVCITNSGGVVVDVSYLLDNVDDVNLKNFLNEQLHNMSNELLRAYWANSRGELFNYENYFNLYRVPHTSIKVGDLCISMCGLKDTLDNNMSVYDRGVAKAIITSYRTYEVIDIDDDFIYILNRGWRIESRICKIARTQSNKLAVFRRVLFILAPFIRYENKSYSDSLYKTALNKYSEVDILKVDDSALYQPQENNQRDINSRLEEILTSAYSGERVHQGSSNPFTQAWVNPSYRIDDEEE